MELNEQDISLIDQYLEGKLTGSELAAFRKRMEEDAAFKAEVKLQADVVAALKADGKARQKAQLGAIQAAMLAAGEIKPYTPSLGGSESGNGGSGGGGAAESFLKWLLWLVITGGIAGAVWYYFSHRGDENRPGIFNIFEKSDSNTTIRRDTIERIEYHGDSSAAPVPGRKDRGGPGGAKPVAGSVTHVTEDKVVQRTDTIMIDVVEPLEGGPTPSASTTDKEKPSKGPTGKVKVPQEH